MAKAQLRAAQTVEAIHLFPTIPSGYSLKFQRIKVPFRLRVEIPVSLKEHVRVFVCDVLSTGGGKMI